MYDINSIHRLCLSYDKLQFKWSEEGVNHHKRWKLRKAGARMQNRIKNLVKDFHCRYNNSKGEFVLGLFGKHNHLFEYTPN